LNTHEDRAVDYVEHIIAAIDKINQYTAGLDKAQFLAADVVRDAVVWQLVVIGEASSKLIRHCPQFTAAHPEVRWRSAYDTRNRLAHGYATIEFNIVWEIIKKELPALHAQMQALFGSLLK
jgi:uncharacterized protein with HEPN domain